MDKLIQKNYKSIIKPILSNQRQLIFGVSFTNPPDLLTMFKQHFYSLFLIIYFYGQPKHKALIINKLYECEIAILHQIQKHKFKCISTKNQCNQAKCSQKNKYCCRINQLKFTQKELGKINQKGKPFISLHNLQEREIIRKSFLMLFEKEKKLQKTSHLSFVDFCRLAGSLLDIDISVKNYWNAYVIQFNCEQFKKNNKAVFIEININQKTYSYIKRCIEDAEGQMRQALLRNNTCVDNNAFKNTLQFSYQDFNNSYFYKMIRVQQSFLVGESQQQKKHEIMDQLHEVESIDYGYNSNQMPKQEDQYCQSTIEGKECGAIKYTIDKKAREQNNIKKMEQKTQQLQQQYEESQIMQKMDEEIKYKKYQTQLQTPLRNQWLQHQTPQNNQFLQPFQEKQDHQNHSQGQQQNQYIHNIPVSKLQILLEKKYQRARKTSAEFEQKFIEEKFYRSNTNYRPQNRQSTNQTFNDNQSMIYPEGRMLENENTDELCVPNGKCFQKSKQLDKQLQSVFRTNKQQTKDDDDIIEQHSEAEPLQLQKLQNQVLQQRSRQNKERREKKKQRRQRKLSLGNQFENMTSTIRCRNQEDNQDFDLSILQFHSEIKLSRKQLNLNDKTIIDQIQLNDFARMLKEIQRQKIQQYQQFLNQIQRQSSKISVQNSTLGVIKQIINQSIQQNIQSYLEKVRDAIKRNQIKAKGTTDNTISTPDQHIAKKQNKFKVKAKNTKRGQQTIKFPSNSQISHQQLVKNISKTILRQKGSNLKELYMRQDQSKGQIDDSKKKNEFQGQSRNFFMTIKQMMKAGVIMKNSQYQYQNNEEFDMDKTKILKMSEYSPSKKVKQAYLKYSSKKVK